MHHREISFSASQPHAYSLFPIYIVTATKLMRSQLSPSVLTFIFCVFIPRSLSKRQLRAKCIQSAFLLLLGKAESPRGSLEQRPSAPWEGRALNPRRWQSWSPDGHQSWILIGCCRGCLADCLSWAGERKLSRNSLPRKTPCCKSNAKAATGTSECWQW